jgi:hypothetical protein
VPNFNELFVFAPRAAIVDHLTQAAKALLQRRRKRSRQRIGRAPPALFQGNNHLRRDIGLPPLDRNGMPM